MMKMYKQLVVEVGRETPGPGPGLSLKTIAKKEMDQCCAGPLLSFFSLKFLSQLSISDDMMIYECCG